MEKKQYLESVVFDSICEVDFLCFVSCFVIYHFASLPQDEHLLKGGGRDGDHIDLCPTQDYHLLVHPLIATPSYIVVAWPPKPSSRRVT